MVDGGRRGDKNWKRQEKDPRAQRGEGLTMTHGDLRGILEIRRFRKCVLLSTRIPHRVAPPFSPRVGRDWKSKYVLSAPCIPACPRIVTINTVNLLLRILKTDFSLKVSLRKESWGTRSLAI